MPITYQKMTYSDYGLTARIPVKFPPGATLTCSHEKGAASYSITNDTGLHTFKVHTKGVWTISVTDGLQTDAKTVTITHDGQVTENIILAFTGIFGIQRNILSESTAWIRTDMAVGATATPSIGTIIGHSDFDKVLPWGGIVREKIRDQISDSDDVMVKIPKFYFQRYLEGDIEHIRISSLPQDGFSVHPVFKEGDKEHDYIYVGAYCSYYGSVQHNGTWKNLFYSQNDKTIETKITRDAARQGTLIKGSGWHLFDIAAWSAIQMLFLVEFAEFDSKKILGFGRDGSRGRLKTGTCDNVPNLTGRPAGGDGDVDIVYRGIEGIWGNVGVWVDGINASGSTYYICTNPSNYRDNTSSGYTRLSYHGESESTQFKHAGNDTANPWAMLCPYHDSAWWDEYWALDGPNDIYTPASGWGCLNIGFDSAESRHNIGLFYQNFSRTSSGSSAYVGSRIMYIPS